jgi:cold shock CspA family protein
VRKFALLAAVAVLALVGAAVAYAATDSVGYSATVSPSKAPKKGKAPVSVTYKATLTVRATPAGTQPDGASKVDLFFAKQLTNGGKRFPSPCKQKDIDSKPSIPKKCNPALVGTGSAKAFLGQPGSAQNPAASETFSVKLFNANKGKGVLLVLNGTSPLPVHNRVIPGTVKKLSGGSFGYEVTFTIPPNLQTIGGIPSVVTDLTATVGKKSHGVGYIALASCPKSKKLSAKAVEHFNNGTTGTGSSTLACK